MGSDFRPIFRQVLKIWGGNGSPLHSCRTHVFSTARRFEASHGEVWRESGTSYEGFPHPYQTPCSHLAWLAFLKAAYILCCGRRNVSAEANLVPRPLRINVTYIHSAVKGLGTRRGLLMLTGYKITGRELAFLSPFFSLSLARNGSLKAATSLQFAINVNSVTRDMLICVTTDILDQSTVVVNPRDQIIS